jgi:hypothetical protein
VESCSQHIQRMQKSLDQMNVQIHRVLILLCHKSAAQTTTQRTARKLLYQEAGDLDT